MLVGSTLAICSDDTTLYTTIALAWVFATSASVCMPLVRSHAGWEANATMPSLHSGGAASVTHRGGMTATESKFRGERLVGTNVIIVLLTIVLPAVLTTVGNDRDETTTPENDEGKTIEAFISQESGCTRIVK